jgi:hypothetical protein
MGDSLNEVMGAHPCIIKRLGIANVFRLGFSFTLNSTGHTRGIFDQITEGNRLLAALRPFTGGNRLFATNSLLRQWEATASNVNYSVAL